MSLTITPPYRDTENDAVQCIYFGVGSEKNKVITKIERRDFEVVDTQNDGSGLTQINITGTLPTLTVGGTIFVNIGTFGFSGIYLWGPYKILSQVAGAVIIDLGWVGTAMFGGYINLTTDRPKYFVQTHIQLGLPDITMAPADLVMESNGLVRFFERRDVPRQDGILEIDLAEQLRACFTKINIGTYSPLREQDYTSCSIYGVNHTEAWVNSDELPNPEYVIGAVNAALQVQHRGGTNMELYLPTPGANHKARLLTDSARLRMWTGMPFDIHALIGFDVIDGANAGFLCTHQVEYTQGVVGTVTDLPFSVNFFDRLIQRFIVLGASAPVDRVNWSINYSNLPTNITEEIQIRLVHSIPCNPVYLCWLNKLGGLNYWCFSGRQTIGKKTTSGGEFEPGFNDLETQYTTSSFLTKGSEKYMIAGGDVMDAYDTNIMDSLSDSPRVFLLMNTPTWATAGPVWREVKVDIGDIKLLDTRKRNNPFEIKIRLPETFIQKL